MNGASPPSPLPKPASRRPCLAPSRRLRLVVARPLPLPLTPGNAAARSLVIGLFVIALLWAAYVAQPVIVPVVLAWVIATIVLPIVTWLRDRNVPRVVAVLLVTLALVAVIIALLLLLSTPVAYWIGRASEIAVLVKQKLQTVNSAAGGARRTAQGGERLRLGRADHSQGRADRPPWWRPCSPCLRPR